MPISVGSRNHVVGILVDTSSGSCSNTPTGHRLPHPPAHAAADLSPTLQHNNDACSQSQPLHSAIPPRDSPSHCSDSEENRPLLALVGHLPLSLGSEEDLPLLLHPIGSKRSRDELPTLMPIRHPSPRKSNSSAAAAAASTTPEAAPADPAGSNRSSATATSHPPPPPNAPSTEAGIFRSVVHDLSQLSSQQEVTAGLASSQPPQATASAPAAEGGSPVVGAASSANATPPLSPREQFKLLRKIMNSPAARRCCGLPLLAEDEAVSPLTLSTSSSSEGRAEEASCDPNIPLATRRAVYESVGAQAAPFVSDQGVDVSLSLPPSHHVSQRDKEIGMSPPCVTAVDAEVQCTLLGGPLVKWGEAEVPTDQPPTTPQRMASANCQSSPETEPTPAARRLSIGPTVRSLAKGRGAGDDGCVAVCSPNIPIARQSTATFHAIHPSSHDHLLIPHTERSHSAVLVRPTTFSAEPSQIGTTQGSPSATGARAVSSVVERSTVSHVSASRSPAKMLAIDGGLNVASQEVVDTASEGGSASRRNSGGESPFCQRQLNFSSGTFSNEPTSSQQQRHEAGSVHYDSNSIGLDTQIANALDALGVNPGPSLEVDRNEGLFRLAGVTPPRGGSLMVDSQLNDSQLSRLDDSDNTLSDSQHTTNRRGAKVASRFDFVGLATTSNQHNPATAASREAPPQPPNDGGMDSPTGGEWRISRKQQQLPAHLLDSQHVVFDHADDLGW